MPSTKPVVGAALITEIPLAADPSQQPRWLQDDDAPSTSGPSRSSPSFVSSPRQRWPGTATAGAPRSPRSPRTPSGLQPPARRSPATAPASPGALTTPEAVSSAGVSAVRRLAFDEVNVVPVAWLDDAQDDGRRSGVREASASASSPASPSSPYPFATDDVLQLAATAQPDVEDTELNGQLCRSVQLWVCLRLLPGGAIEVYESTAAVGPLNDDIWQRLKQAPAPVATLPAGLRTFEQCEGEGEGASSSGTWRSYAVRITGDFGPSEEEVMYPNCIELTASGRRAFNVGSMGHLLDFLADPTRDGIQRHLDNLLPVSRSFSACYRRLVSKWGPAALLRFGFSKAVIARQLEAHARRQLWRAMERSHAQLVSSQQLNFEQ